MVDNFMVLSERERAIRPLFLPLENSILPNIIHSKVAKDHYSVTKQTAHKLALLAHRLHNITDLNTWIGLML